MMIIIWKIHLLAFLPFSVALDCSAGWVSYHSSCYYYHTSAMTWYNAKLHCESKQANLTTIQSRAEEEYLIGWVNGAQVWIGMIRDTSNPSKFVWLDGSPADAYQWLSGQPNNGGGNQDCIHIYSTGGGLNDERCTDAFRFLCEISTPDPAFSIDWQTLYVNTVNSSILTDKSNATCIDTSRTEMLQLKVRLSPPLNFSTVITVSGSNLPCTQLTWKSNTQSMLVYMDAAEKSPSMQAYSGYFKVCDLHERDAGSSPSWCAFKCPLVCSNCTTLYVTMEHNSCILPNVTSICEVKIRWL